MKFVGIPTEEDIVSYISGRQYVSWANLVDDFPDMFGGEIAFHMEKYYNIIIWFGFITPSYELISKMWNKSIFIHPTTILVYVVDGHIPRMPIAKSERQYKEPHWVPTTLCTFPHKTSPYYDQWVKDGSPKQWINKEDVMADVS